jgi:hypothetical protein
MKANKVFYGDSGGRSFLKHFVLSFLFYIHTEQNANHIHRSNITMDYHYKIIRNEVLRCVRPYGIKIPRGRDLRNKVRQVPYVMRHSFAWYYCI